MFKVIGYTVLGLSIFILIPEGVIPSALKGLHGEAHLLLDPIVTPIVDSIKSFFLSIYQDKV